MNKNLALVTELLLVAVYLILVIVVIDTSEVSGLVMVGIATVVIFPIVLIIDKKREKKAAPAVDISAPAAETPAQPAQTAAPSQPVQAAPQQAAQAPQQPPQQ